MHLFYTPDVNGDTCYLNEQESKHSVRVLRLGKGSALNLVDGKGGWYEAIIDDDNPKKCRLKIISHSPGYHPLSNNLHVAISPLKSVERFEWFAEKATEIGISQITPVICQRTERRRVNIERTERIIISAMKQSYKAFKPVLNEPRLFSEFINQEYPGARAIAHCSGTERLALHQIGPSDNYTVLVGPEGDFTEAEVDLAVNRGFQQVHLGDSRLRTETAGVFICTAIQLIGHKKNRP